MKAITLSLIVALGASFAFADDTKNATAQTEVKQAELTKPVKTPIKYGLNATTMWFDSQGAKAAKDNLYSFEDANARVDLLVGSAQLPNGWTAMVIGSHVENYFETRIGNYLSKDYTRGMGDTQLLGVKFLPLTANQFVIFEGGLSLPTGTINFKNKANKARNYAYNMQMGSGTVDVPLAATYIYAAKNKLQQSLRLAPTVRTGRNDNGYRLGNLLIAQASTEYKGLPYLTPMVRFNYRQKEAINGIDPAIGRSKYTEFYHHDQINWDLSAIAKSSIPIKALGATSLDLEAGIPLVQGMKNVDNVQVDLQYFAKAALQGTF